MVKDGSVGTDMTDSGKGDPASLTSDGSDDGTRVDSVFEDMVKKKKRDGDERV